MDNKQKKEIVYIPLEDIIPNRFQPRLAFDENELNELSNSIIKYGVLEPIIVRQIGEKYEIIAGERRYKATTLAGLSKIPAIIHNTDDNTSAEIALLENLQRKNLTVIEEAKSFKKLLDRGFTQESIASKLGISQSSIANKIRLLNLPKKVQEALLHNKISERHARSLLSINDEEKQLDLLKKILDEKLTVKQTEDEIEKTIKGVKEEEKPEEVIDDDDFMAGFKSVVTFDNIPTMEEYNKESFSDYDRSKELLEAINNKNNYELIENEKFDTQINIENMPENISNNIGFNPFASKEISYNNIDTKIVTKEEVESVNNFANTLDKLRTFITNLDDNNNINITTSEEDNDNKYRIIIEIDKDAY